jgi:polyferredoxin
MDYDKTLRQIPIVGADARSGRRLHLTRRAVQIGSIVLAILIPVSGLFRIDPVEGAFVVLDRQVWFSDFYIVVGLWMAVSSSLVMTYSFVGTAFCGWSCPQNTMAEWANRMTYRWLGKRAEVSLDGSPMRVSQGKDKWLNWFVLGAMILGVSMAAAFVPMFYFYPPDVLWSFVTFRDDPRLAGSLHYIYAIFVLILFLDIAFIRHFWCRFMCIYRVWQHSFKTRETLRIVHDDSHPNECGRCNYCETACFIGIDPRRTDTYDSCINCGECIAACSSVRSSRKSGSSLLRFAVGDDDGGRASKRSNVGSIFARLPWATVLTIAGLAMFFWGLDHYQSFHFSAYRAETLQGEAVRDYRISVANKLYRRTGFAIEVDGLPREDYQLSRDRVSFVTAGRTDVNLHIGAELTPGLHPFVVRVRADDGRSESFRVQHFVAKEQL